MSETEQMAAVNESASVGDIEVVAVLAGTPLDELVGRVTATGASIVIERDQSHRAAIVTLADLEDLRRLRQAEQRREALAKLERLNAEWAASGLGFDDEEAERIGRELGDEVNRAITERLRGGAAEDRRSA